MPKKLIEVALPLEAINAASAREKALRHGHPATLHLWWARRPLAACRAVLFASLVDDPSAHPVEFPSEEAQQHERERLFRILEDLVRWESSNDEGVLGRARLAIARSLERNGAPTLTTAPTSEQLIAYLQKFGPPIHDPFCGGGSIPLEAQRLGLRASGSDLNPVAVLITKALVEIPSMFANLPPVNSESRRRIGADENWRGACGLAADVRHYGKWFRDEAQRRIGNLYPNAKLPDGGEATVIAWIWARTVRCPNPACNVEMPLVRSFALSTKKGNEAWVEPVVDRKTTPATITYRIASGSGKPPVGTVARTGARCIACSASVDLDHVRSEGNAKRMSTSLMAIVAEGDRKRIYLPPTTLHVAAANVPIPKSAPDTVLPIEALGFRVQGYGLTHHRDLFTARQLVALTTLCDLIGELRRMVKRDAANTLRSDDESLANGGCGSAGYADAIATYCGLAIGKQADMGSAQCTWHSGAAHLKIRNTFGRQTVPMTWDFAEGNPFSSSSGNLTRQFELIAEVIDALPPLPRAQAFQQDAQSQSLRSPTLISTDPPYYDNIGYADLSDFFYPWLRQSIGSVWPALFGTLLVPKAEELIAAAHRFGGKQEAARDFFEIGLGKTFAAMRACQDAQFPLTVFYAFKQSEEGDDTAPSSSPNGTSATSTGWQTMLEGLVKAGLLVDGTWPVRSELGNRMRSLGSNALASSIVLVCRARPNDAPEATRRELLETLHNELPAAVRALQASHIAPVDLPQAAIGPGMAIFSRYARVLEPNGKAMTIRTALSLINQALDEVLAEEDADLDRDTRWAIAWFELHGMSDGAYDEAEKIARAKNTSVDGMKGRMVFSKGGKVRFLQRDELDPKWDPTTDERLTSWEIVQHLVRELLGDGGYAGASAIVSKIGARADVVPALVHRLFRICDQKKWSQDAQAFAAVHAAWSTLRKDASGSQQKLALNAT